MTKVTAQAKELASALSWASKINSKTSSLKEAETVYVVLEKNELRFSAYDGNSIYSSKIGIQRENTQDNAIHKASISTALATSLVRVLRTGEATLEFQDKTLFVKMPRTTTTLPLMNVRRQSVPAVPVSVGSLLSQKFKRAIMQVGIAVSNDPASVSLTGVLLEFDPKAKKLSFISCDRYQLAIKQVSYAPSDISALKDIDDGVDRSFLEDKFRVLIPYSELKKLMTGLEDDLTLDLHADPNSSFFGITSVDNQGYINIFQDEYVQYEKFLSMQSPNQVFVSSSEFKSALSDVIAFGGIGEPVEIKIDAENSLMTLSTLDKSAQAEIEIEPQLESSNETFLFSPEYLNKSLGALDSRKFVYHYNVSTKPVVLKEVDDNDKIRDRWYHLMMPRRS